MSQENTSTEQEHHEPNSMTSEASSQSPATTNGSSAESGIIINIDQVQSIDISDRFTRQKTADGWSITLHQQAKITINFITSMRKVETVLTDGDVIERTQHDLIILRKHPPDAYRSQRSTSSLARSRGELLQGGTKSETTVL